MRPSQNAVDSGVVDSREYDAIVVGVGGMGSAAVYHLARRGARALGIEQFDIPHELGSSHGLSRIIRLAYAEGSGYVPLLRRAYELWRELETRAGEQLLIITGGIDAGTRRSATVRGSLRSCRDHQLQHEVLDAETLHARFPGYCLPAEMFAVFQPDGGFLLPERCIVAHVQAARQLGAEVHTRERVMEWEVRNGSVEIRTDRRSYRSKKMIVTAGPWARAVVPALAQVAVPERQVVIWTQPLRPESFSLGAFPVFNIETPRGRFYGFPVYGVPGFKIGKYNHREERVDPDQMDRVCHPEDEAVLREGIRAYFPDADGPTLAMKTCLFTNSPDEHFILDTHPVHREIAVAAGFSGHGFSSAASLGRL